MASSCLRSWSMRSTVKLSSTIFRRNTSFGVERERRESERKKIEAEGIREFQRVVSQGISDSYLRWRGIEATLQLSQSTNSKVVIIGSGKDGLPIILNTDTAAPAAAATPAEDTTGKQRTTAAGPAVPLEKTPADALATPSEKIPPMAPATPPAAAPSTSSVAMAEEPRSFWPLSLATIKSYLLNWLGATEPKTATP